MIATIEALIATKYGKVALEIFIVAMLIFGAWKYAEHLGAKGQKETDEQKQTQDIEKSRQEAQTARDQLVKQANDRADASDRRAEAAEARFEVATDKLQQLAGRQQAGNDHLKGLADSEVHGDVISQLKLRAPGDATACYTPTEERAIDNAVTQYPLCREQVKDLGDQVTAEQDRTAAAKDKVADKQQVIDADEAYIGILKDSYKKLFDQHPPRYRSWSCLGLWKCGKKHVNFNLPERAANAASKTGN